FNFRKDKHTDVNLALILYVLILMYVSLHQDQASQRNLHLKLVILMEGNVTGKHRCRLHNLLNFYEIYYSNYWGAVIMFGLPADRSEEHTSELQSRFDLVCRLLLEL